MLKIAVILCVIYLGAATGKTQHVKYKSHKSKYSTSPASYRGNYNDPYAPNFPNEFQAQPFLDPFEFHNQLTAYIQGQQYLQNRVFQENFARQQAYFDALQRQAYYNSGAGSGSYAGAYAGGSGGGLYSGTKGSYAPNYAFASGSNIGGKHYGSAAVYPSNPKIPNIHNRFGGDSVSSGPGFHSVSSSSFSESSNINGQPHSRRGAQTTFNDNGKITTYRTHS